jgi:hypothetical protein
MYRCRPNRTTNARVAWVDLSCPWREALGAWVRSAVARFTETLQHQLARVHVHPAPALLLITAAAMAEIT